MLICCWNIKEFPIKECDASLSPPKFIKALLGIFFYLDLVSKRTGVKRPENVWSPLTISQQKLPELRLRSKILGKIWSKPIYERACFEWHAKFPEKLHFRHVATTQQGLVVFPLLRAAAEAQVKVRPLTTLTGWEQQGTRAAADKFNLTFNWLFVPTL